MGIVNLTKKSLDVTSAGGSAVTRSARTVPYTAISHSGQHFLAVLGIRGLNPPIVFESFICPGMSFHGEKVRQVYHGSLLRKT